MHAIFNQKKKENIFKLRNAYSKHRLLLLSFLFFFLFSTWVKVFATDWPYAPGTNLNPGCLPSDSTCTVSIGTVTSMSVVSANGISGTVATGTTTPALTLTLGAITPTTVNGLTITSTVGTLTIPNNASAAFILSGNFSTTLTSTATTTVTLPTSGTLYGTASDSITSAQLATSLTNETGSGLVVFDISPSLTTPSFLTSATTPILIGGSTSTSTLALRSTSGVGATGADIVFQTGNNGLTEGMRILNSGSVGVGDSSPASLFTVGNGDLFQINSSGAIASATGITSSGSITFSGILATGAGDVPACVSTLKVVTFGPTCGVSSKRFKHDINNLTNNLNKVLALRPVSFKYNFNDQEDIGFIAEEVNSIEPRLVFYEDDGVTPRGLRYDKFVSLLAGGLQELDLKVKGIEQTLADIIKTKELHTDKLCVGSVCVTEEQFMRMVGNPSALPVPVEETPTSPPPAPVVQSDPSPLQGEGENAVPTNP